MEKYVQLKITYCWVNLILGLPHFGNGKFVFFIFGENSPMKKPLLLSVWLTTDKKKFEIMHICCLASLNCPKNKKDFN